jgi:hypothetical protein
MSTKTTTTFKDDAQRARFVEDAESMLENLPGRRSVATILETRMRGLGWTGIAGKFCDICSGVGFFVYYGDGARSKRSRFVSMVAKPPDEPDSFRLFEGFVIVNDAGEFLSMTRPPGWTSRKARARAWQTRQGVLGFAARKGYDAAQIREIGEFQ